MENLIIKNIFENSAKINSLAKCINKVTFKYGLCFIFTGLAIVTITETIIKQQEEINNLKTEIEEMKSKGE